jgi:hypothetical protein
MLKKRKGLKPVVSHFIGSRVGSPDAFKPWVNWIRELVEPPHRLLADHQTHPLRELDAVLPGVALQVAFL